MSRIRICLSALGLAGLPLLSTLAPAGTTPKVSTWINPLGGDWFDPTNWTPTGVPGAGMLLDVDALLDIAGPSPQQVNILSALTLRDLTLRGATDLRIDEVVNVSGDFRFEDGLLTTLTRPARMEIAGDAWFGAGAHATVLGQTQIKVGGVFENDGVIVAPGAIRIESDPQGPTSVNRGTMDVVQFRSTHFRNEGEFIARRGALLAFSFVNTGTMHFIEDYPTSSSSGPDFGVLFENTGSVLIDANVVDLKADRFVHDGAFVALSDEATVTFRNGDHHFTKNASFDPLLDLVFTTDFVQSVTSEFSTGADVEFRGNSWMFDGALDFDGDARFDVENLLDFQGGVSLRDGLFSSDTIVFHAGLTSTAGVVIRDTGSTTISGPVHLTGNTRLSRGTFDLLSSDVVFEGSLTLDAAHATFASPLHVNGNLSVLSNTVLTTPASSVTATGNIVWSTLADDLDLALEADGEITVGARRINATLAADRIRISGGQMELNADLFAENQVVIGAAALSIGPMGEITTRTIHGDVSSTYALSQRWDFDLAGSGSRGIAVSDTLIINGDATLYGVLRTHTLGDASDFRLGDAFTLFSADSIDALFPAVFLPTLDNGLFFEVVYDPSAVRLVVVPAPGAWLALGLPLGLAGRRHRSTLAES